MFEKLFSIFKSDRNTKNDLKDEKGKTIQKSSVVYSKSNERFLKLEDDGTVAIVLYPNDRVEVVFTRSYDPENQKITPNEESLMAMALFMKQPGFLEMLKKEFRRIAMEKISTLTSNLEK